MPDSAGAGSAAPPRRPPFHPAGVRHRARYRWADGLFQGVLTAFGLVVIVLVMAIAVELVISAWPAITRFGLAFLWTSRWDPVHNAFGALTFLYGTLASSFLALLDRRADQPRRRHLSGGDRGA